MAAAIEQPKPQTVEVGTELGYIVPNWGTARPLFGLGNYIDQRETVPELKWPNSVRLGGPFQRMGTDTQLSGLMRGTTLPIRRYVWGIDPNGAPQAAIDGVCRTYNLELIDDAWDAFQTGESAPIPRARNDIMFDQHLADVLKAPRYGHFYFEHWGPIGPDGLWAPQELAARPPWSITGILIDDKGKLLEVRQRHAIEQKPPIPASALVTYVNDKDPGDWTGRSMFRSCYREWLAKDELIRIDLINHANAGGKLIPTAAQGATPREIEGLAQLSSQLRVEGGGAVPAGTDLTFIRATGSDVIASVNRHDEAMAREFLMMFMSLGTSSSGGNRALASSFIDWFAISQESIAIWARDVFNDQVIRPYVDTNWAEVDFLPRLVFRRPEAANPLDTVADAVAKPAGAPGAVVDTADPTEPVSAARLGAPGAIVVDDETRDALLTAHALLERDLGRKPKNTRARRAARAAAPTVSLPDRPLRRDPTDIEVRAAVDFAAVDANWVSAVDQLVASWKTIRAAQVTELHDKILAANGDLTELAKLEATVDGGDVIAARLTQMAHTGAAEAVAEASRQGVAATLPDTAALAGELEARAGALEQLLSRALSGAVATKAVQLTGAQAEPATVAQEVVSYVDGLSDAYLTDQFGGALSAAQNTGRLAAMDHNGATSYYSSELLDTNTCEPCSEVDGTEYASADAAAVDYPGGGYFDCAGGPRCRGTVVAVYDEAAPSA